MTGSDQNEDQGGPTKPSGQSCPATMGQPADDEVTETKIVGVTETGVIRKRSFKRKLTKEEKSKVYGQAKEDYTKIVKRVLEERWVTSAIESLQERWKMLRFMHEDCMDMVNQWETTRTDRLRKLRQGNITVLLSGIAAMLVVVVVLWLTFKLIW